MPNVGASTNSSRPCTGRCAAPSLALQRRSLVQSANEVLASLESGIHPAWTCAVFPAIFPSSSGTRERGKGRQGSISRVQIKSLSWASCNPRVPFFRDNPAHCLRVSKKKKKKKKRGGRGVCRSSVCRVFIRRAIECGLSPLELHTYVTLSPRRSEYRYTKKRRSAPSDPHWYPASHCFWAKVLVRLVRSAKTPHPQWYRSPKVRPGRQYKQGRTVGRMASYIRRLIFGALCRRVKLATSAQHATSMS
jgi:hypothetical protein